MKTKSARIIKVGATGGFLPRDKLGSVMRAFMEFPGRNDRMACLATRFPRQVNQGSFSGDPFRIQFLN